MPAAFYIFFTVTLSQGLTEGFLNKSVHVILAHASADLVLWQRLPSSSLRFHFSPVLDEFLAGAHTTGKPSI